MNTIEFLQISSAVVPDREALVEFGGNNKRITYGEMYPAVVKLANALQGLGIERGQNVAAMSVNSADYVLTYYACAMLGVSFVPLNYRAKDEELTHMLNVSQCQAVFVSDRYLDLVERIRPTLTHTQHFVAYGGGQGGFLDYNELVARSPEEEIWAEVDDKDATIIIFTSDLNGTVKNSREMVNSVVAAAERAGVPYRLNAATLGVANDSGSFSRTGLKAATLFPFKIPQHMVAFYHQKWDGPEVLTMEPLLNVLKLTFEWVRCGGEGN